MQLYHIVLNNINRRKAKMLFVLLGLIIGIATIVSVYGIVETMKTEMTKQVTEFGVNMVITPNSGGLTFSYGGITLPEIMYDVNEMTMEDLDKINTLPSKDMIRIAAPKLLGTLPLENMQKVTIVGAHLKEEFMIKPWLRMSSESTQQENDASLNSEQQSDEKMKMVYEAIDLTREDISGLNLSDNQIISGAAAAQSLGLKKGDIITLAGKSFEVYATLLESGTAQDQQLFMNLSAAQDALNRPNEITVIEMAADYLAGSEEALLTEIRQALPHAEVKSLRQETLRQDEMLTRIIRFGMTISIVVLLAGMFVVGLTMLSSVRERTREIGVFRAIGFQRKHITQMIVMEGTLVSIAGGIIGYIIGMLAASYAGPLFIGAQMQVPWSFGLLLIAIGISVVIGLISSLYPAYQAAKMDPVEALRFI